MYPPREQHSSGGDGGGAGVQKGTDGVIGSGAYPTGWNGEFKANEKVLKQLRGQEAGPKIWQHLMDTFQSVRG